jgi:hypothetical protein
MNEENRRFYIGGERIGVLPACSFSLFGLKIINILILR